MGPPDHHELLPCLSQLDSVSPPLKELHQLEQRPSIVRPALPFLVERSETLVSQRLRRSLRNGLLVALLGLVEALEMKQREGAEHPSGPGQRSRSSARARTRCSWRSRSPARPCSRQRGSTGTDDGRGELLDKRPVLDAQGDLERDELGLDEGGHARDRTEPVPMSRAAVARSVPSSTAGDDAR